MPFYSLRFLWFTSKLKQQKGLCKKFPFYQINKVNICTNTINN